jgi:CRP-like cAMP-binding protein
MEFTRLLVFQLRKLQIRVQDLVFRGAAARLAHLLLDLGGATGSGGRSSIRIDAKLTHQEMANVVGCARETVSTILGQLRDQGLIKIDGRSIIVLNQCSLSRLVA